MRNIITSIACFLLFCCFSTNAQTTTFTANGGTFSCATNEFCVTIDVTDFDSIINMQFAMQWDTAVMQINSWTSLLPPQEFFNPSETTEGRLGFLWGGSNGSLDLNDGTSIIELCFAPNGGGTSAIEFIPPLITGGIIEVSGFRNGQLLQNVPSEFNNGTVMISDITAPVITCPNDTIITGGGTVVGNLTPVITDDCSTFSTTYVLEIGGTMVGSGSGDASGTFFNPGTTTVTYTATDASNNSVSCSFDVTVDGTTPPDDGVLEYIPTINFDCNNNTAVMCLIVNNFDSITSHQMGIFYDTSALEYVSFNRDLSGTGTFNPNIFPDAAFYTWAHPVTPGGANSTTLPDGSKILTVNFNIVGDLVSPLITIDDFSPITPVQVSMEGMATPLVRDVDYVFLPDVVTIIDEVGPTLTGACENISADTDLGDCGARLVIPTPVATDECSGVDSMTYTIDGITTLLDPGATEFSQNFAVGMTSVTITAYDGNGNTSECSFSVTVQDAELPSVACPMNVEIDAAAGQTSVVVNDIAPLGFTENCPGAMITYTTDDEQSGDDDASGLSFPVGVTTVTYLIEDAAGNESNCSFTVTINQLNAPEDLEFQPTITVDCATDTVTYCLFTDNFNDITQLQMGIRYDNTALEFISATKEVPGAGGAPNPNLSPEHVFYAWSRPTPVTLEDGTKLLTIKFALIGEVTFPLTLIEDIGPGLEIMIEDANGPVDIANDVVFLPEIGSQTTDTQGPVLLSGCLEITVENDEDVCGANLDIPAPTAQDFCSGVASITYEIDGVETTFPAGATSFNADFPVGTTEVRFRAFDGAGNESNCGLDVIVTDGQAPDLVCPSTDVIPNDPGECNAFVDFSLQPTSFSDNCAVEEIRYNITGGVSMTGIGLVQPQKFPVGQSLITYTVSDAAGNSTTCQIIIEVGDTEIPTITCPENIEVTIPPGDTSTIVFLDVPMGTDNCSDDLMYTYTVEGITFPVTEPIGVGFSIGETTVTGTVNDTNEGASCTFTVTVIQAGPEDLIECPQNTFSCTPTVTGIDPVFLADEDDVTVTYTLDFEGTITGGNGSANGLDFMPGTTLVTYNATGLGTTEECTFEVTVDNIDPVTMSCPGPIVIFADADNCTTPVSWEVPVITDNCGLETFIPTHNPGDLFDPGITTVIYAAVDSAGNSANCVFTVEIRDTLAPVVTNCPPNDLLTTPAPEICGAIATWTVPGATDNCGNVIVTNSHSPGDTFFITTTVIYTFTDDFGNNSFCSFIINVDNADTDPPVIINCPVDTVIFAPSTMCGIPYVWEEPTITDACSDAFINSPTFMPGDTFELGATTVGYLGFDAAGNQATCNFTVTVRDTTPPNLFCPSTVLAFATEADQCGTVVNSFDLPMAFDNCSNNIGVVCTDNPGDFFEVGTTTVTCTAIDDSGNESTCIFNVIVEDQFVPIITCPDDIVVNLDGMLVSGTPGIVSSIVANNNCDSVLLSFNLPMGVDNCPIGMPEQIEGPANGTLVAIGMETNFGFILSDGANVSDTCRFNITVNPITDITISGGTDEYCSGDSFILSVDSISGATYEWTLPLGNTVAGSTLAVSDITPGVNIGNYTVVCRLADNCESTATITINDIQDSPIFEASANGDGCNSSVQLLVAFDTNSPTPDSVRWNGPNDYTSTVTEPVIDNPVSGNYTIIAYNNSCSATQTVNLSTVNIPNVSIFSDCGDDGICVGDNCNLIGTATTDPTLEFNWMAEAGCTILINEDGNIANITPVDQGSCVIMYWLSKDDGCTSDTAFFVVNVTGAPVAIDDFVAINSGTTEIGIDILGNDELTENVIPSVRAVTQPNDGVITFDDINQTFLFAVDESFVDLNQFQYEICYECDGMDLCSQAIVTIELQDTSCMVPSLITPNDDGFNDELIINCLRGEDFPDAEMIIYNQWGDEVYRRKPYGNGVWWDGTYNGDPVTDGSYYYLFTKETGGSVTRGYLTVYR